MIVASVLLKIFAATMLLLFAVRLVRTGIERRFGGLFQKALIGHSNPVWAAGAGLTLAVTIQSSAAVALLLTGFAAAGMVPFGLALAGVLGADLGSALVVQVLTIDLSWLMPVLLAIGGWLYLKAARANMRLIGRIILGIAFILMSLQFLREAVAPIQNSAFLPAVSGFLAQDYVTAFIVGAVLAFAMHSSVAAILMCVTLVQVDVLPLSAGLSLVLGANLGSALIPIWLTRDLPVAARRIPVANAVLRGSMAALALFAVNLTDAATLFTSPNAGQSLVLAHIAFNATVALLFVGLCTRIERPFALLLPEPETPNDPLEFLKQPISPLATTGDARVGVAMSSVRQELLQMVTQVERMFRPILDLYERDDRPARDALWAQDEQVNDQLNDIRKFVARMPHGKMSEQETRAARGLVEYAIRLEAAGDIMTDRFSRIIQRKHNESAHFSTAGWAELAGLHGDILKSFALARHVLLVDDVECARRLVLDKAEVKRSESASRKAHLRRLELGTTESFQTSDLHLETLRAMRDLHGHIASVAYPLLYRSGQILETRLVMDLETDETDGVS
ncbi:MAG: Na/Pi cotransporter family protein [Paracoccaceae bacterium]